MSYIGNTSTQQSFIAAVDTFNGNGSTTAFTLSRSVLNVFQVEAVIENVPQDPNTAYIVNGNTITFTSAPPSGTGNIYVRYTSPITQLIAPGPGTVGTAQIQNGAVIPADLSLGAPVWDTSGNLGIGTTPSAKLHILSTGNTTADGVRLTFGSEARSHNIYSALPTGRDLTIAPWRALTINTGSGTNEGVLTLNAYEYTVFGTGASYTERMRLDASGRLLVGTTTAPGGTSVLQVLSNSVGAGIQLHNTSLSAGGAINSSNGAGLTFYSYTGAVGSESYAERARITAAGDLLINATSNGYSASVLISANSALRNAVVCQDTGTNYGTGYYYQWFVNSAGNSAGSISHTASTTIAFLTSSDKRLKHNIVDAPSALQKVNDVKVCSFDWIEDGHHVDYGFIAQDLYDVIPEVVGKGDDNETIEDPKGTWQVEYGRLTPILVKAIQEQQAIIEQMQTRLGVLEGVN
jgi:hypothetical protein